MKTVSVLLVAALALSACDILGSGDQLTFEVQMQEVTGHGPDGPTQTGRAELSRVIISGGFTTHCAERAPSANVVSVSRTRINLVITEQQASAACTPLDRFYLYNAVIGPLDHGTYRVDVVHQRIGAAAEVVFSEHFDVN